MTQRPLTPKQKVFVAEYLIDLNATQAAIRAGYSAKTASRIGPELLGKTCIATAIAEQQKARETRTLITADKVLTDIQAVKEDAMQIVLDRDGNKVMADRFAALKAAELLGKHLKLFTDRVEVEAGGGLVERILAARRAHRGQ